MADSADVRATLAGHFAEVVAEAVDVRLQGRHERYWVLTGARPTAG